MKTPNVNRINGRFFEVAFERFGGYGGLLVLRNPLACRFLPGRATVPIKSQLDYTVVHKTGVVAFVDCKSFVGSTFSFSSLNSRQVELARRFNKWNVRAGFACWFREGDKVSYFSGDRLIERRSYSAEDGLVLGTLSSMKLELIFASYGEKY